MLRTYQSDIKDKAYSAMREHRAVCMQLPTGGGKTVIIASVCQDARRAHRAVLILVHRIELVTQTIEQLARYGIIATTNESSIADVYVCMVQTLARRIVQTLARRIVPLVSLVIIDEAHHATANTYKSVLDALPHANVLGVTATPCRLDGKGLGDVFGALVVGADVQQLTSDGWLVPSLVYSANMPPITAKVSRGDYNQRDLSQHMAKSVLHGDLVDTYKAFTPNGKVIVYASSVELSQQYADEYNEAGISAEHIDGTTDATTRRATIDRFRKGQTRVLTNYGIITEGFDVPDCDTIQLVRPTKSLALYLQMVGRGLRASDGKTHCTILDHAGNVKTHGFPDDVRLWGLEGKQKRDNKLPAIVEASFELAPLEKDAIEHLKFVKLERSTRINPDVLVDELIKTANERGYKKGWIIHQWRESCKNPTHEQLKMVAKKLGYHWRWAEHQRNTKSVQPS